MRISNVREAKNGLKIRGRSMILVPSDFRDRPKEWIKESPLIISHNISASLKFLEGCFSLILKFWLKLTFTVLDL